MRPVLITLLVIAGILAALPPFFTRGTCTAEFNAASDAIQQARPRLANLEDARAYLRSKGLLYRTLTAQHCASSPPPGVQICPGGPVLLVDIPVKNRVCRYYRDGSTHVQLGFDSDLQLAHMQMDMRPYHMLKLSFIGVELDWAK